MFNNDNNNFFNNNGDNDNENFVPENLVPNIDATKDMCDIFYRHGFGFAQSSLMQNALTGEYGVEVEFASVVAPKTDTAKGKILHLGADQVYTDGIDVIDSMRSTLEYQLKSTHPVKECDDFIKKEFPGIIVELDGLRSRYTSSEVELFNPDFSTYDSNDNDGSLDW